jgi:hypothetical protein
LDITGGYNELGRIKNRCNRTNRAIKKRSKKSIENAIKEDKRMDDSCKVNTVITNTDISALYNIDKSDNSNIATITPDVNAKSNVNISTSTENNESITITSYYTYNKSVGRYKVTYNDNKLIVLKNDKIHFALNKSVSCIFCNKKYLAFSTKQSVCVYDLENLCLVIPKISCLCVKMDIIRNRLLIANKTFFKVIDIKKKLCICDYYNCFYGENVCSSAISNGIYDERKCGVVKNKKSSKHNMLYDINKLRLSRKYFLVHDNIFYDPKLKMWCYLKSKNDYNQFMIFKRVVDVKSMKKVFLRMLRSGNKMCVRAAIDLGNVGENMFVMEAVSCMGEFGWEIVKALSVNN